MNVILNYLPPGRTDQPSTSLSILQRFLNENGHSAKTIYWNILLFQVMSYYANNQDVFRNLIPFMAELAEEFDDSAVKKRLITYLQALKPNYKVKDHFYENSLKEMLLRTDQIIHTELKKDGNEAVLYGISARFYQWIPGRFLAKAMKQIYPHCKIVIGGLSSRSAAIAMLKKNADFDFAVWGEGEYPLLDLCNHIEHNSIKPEEIHRLVYRENGETKASKPLAKPEYLDFENYIFPDISDYFDCLSNNNLSKEKVQILIHSVCGCYWGKCSFCSYSTDKKFRERTAENIFQEIRQNSEKYGVHNFYMADNEMVGRNVDRFERLLDLLIDFKQNVQPDFKIFGEMIPSKKITPAIFNKMSQAGFKYLFIGYESVTDTLLQKMRKENTFSENILFVKLALKYNIKPQANIIQGIPTENEDDIHESINNLHFLRFLFNTGKIDFSHDFLTLNLYKGTEYYTKMPAHERENYILNPFNGFLPQAFITHEERFDFLSYRRTFEKNGLLWGDFMNVESFYRKNKFSYEILKTKDQFNITEFLNGSQVKRIELNDPVYYEILVEAETHIVTINELLIKLSSQFPYLTENKLNEYLQVLKSNYLIYFDNQFSSIVSTIYL